MDEISPNLEVGYGVARGDNAFTVGAEAARQALLTIEKHPVSAVLVFASAGYDLPQLLQGIRSQTGEAPLLGTATAGEICNEPQQESVVVAVLASPYLKVKIGVGQRVSQDWQQALIEAITVPEVTPYFCSADQALWTKMTLEGKSAFALLFSPGAGTAAGSHSFDILEAVKRLTQGRLPVIGAGTASSPDNYVFIGPTVSPDSLLVAVFETSLKFGISLAHGFRPTIRQTVVTRSSGYEVLELDGRPASKVYRRMQDLPPDSLDLTGCRPLGVADPYGQYRLNLATAFTAGGGVRFTQPVPEGASLRLMEGDRHNLAAAGAEALRKALLRGAITDPAMALVFASAGRNRLLGADAAAEIGGMRDLAPQAPVLGFASFGEQGLADDGVSRHNNGVIAVLALGRELSYAAEVAGENISLRHVFEQHNALYKMNEKLQREIGQRREAEAKLSKSEATLKSILRAAPVGIALVSQRTFSWVNEHFTRLTGYDAGELIGKNSRTLYGGDEEYERVLRNYREMARQSRSAIETRWVDKGGRVIDVLLNSSPVNPADPAGEVIVTALDVTERKQAAEVFKSLIYNAPIGIFITQGGKFRLVNPGFLKLTGYSEDGLLGQDSLQYVPAEFKEMVRTNAIQMLKGLRSPPYEFQIVTKDGETRWMLETVTPIQYDGKRATLGFFLDINERVMLEKQLQQSQKMEAVGRLAGGVAHDFNNMLTAIMGYSEIVMMSFQEDEPIFTHLQGIRKSADRAATLTRQLLAFSRKQLLQPRVTNLNTVITDLERMLRRVIGEDINLIIDLDPALEPVKIDPAQIDQVIMNLVINARDAMPMGGELIIRTANVYLDEAFTRQQEDLLPGPYVKMSVIDRGLGMAPETMAHIFEPFFTTKEAGKGTGLGLSTVYGTVKQSDGHIEVSSKVGEGTVFEIYLRQHQAAAEFSRKTFFPTQPQGSETILVVEDEEILLELIKDALELQGYRVLTARNGMEAMELCRRQPEPIHLLLTDVVMPHKNGRELAKYLAPLHPEMKILFMSGYSEDAMVVRGLVEAALPFIQKPFPPMDLVRKVREMIDSPRN